ncbi:hypothetical protein [Ferruginibacter sp.]
MLPNAAYQQRRCGGLRNTNKGKELTKRTTFVRVQEQHNEWFGGE